MDNWTTIENFNILCISIYIYIYTKSKTAIKEYANQIIVFKEK